MLHDNTNSKYDHLGWLTLHSKGMGSVKICPNQKYISWHLM